MTGSGGGAPPAGGLGAWPPEKTNERRGSRFPRTHAARCLVLGVATLPGTGSAPLEGTTLVLAHPAPHASVLATIECPGQARGSDGAAMANGFCLRDLEQRRTARPHRKEELRVLVTAGRAVAPVHF